MPNIVILIVLIMILVFIIIQEQHKQYIKLLEECNDFADKLLEKTKTELELKKIINNSITTKENYFETLQKIEKELFKQ